MFNIVIFGPPGAGKGTQSKLIIDKYKLTHLSTGDLLRAEMASQTPLGMEAKKLIEKGELVPDDIVIGMVKNKIEASTGNKGFIFDGFPRTPDQAEALDELLAGARSSISVMISLEVEDSELIDRLLKRAEIEGRKDDNFDTIKNRIGVYNEVTSRVMDHYKKTGRARSVNGSGSINEIFNNICSIIDEFEGARV